MSVPDYVPESYVQSATESRSKYFVWSGMVYDVVSDLISDFRWDFH